MADDLSVGIAKPQRTYRVVFWGTYDLGKPRVRLLLAGARAVKMEVFECHAAVWSGVNDKSRLGGVGARWRRLLAWFRAYPALIWRYLHLPPHDVVVVCYLGQLDVLVLWPFARLRGVPMVWDAFLSLYDTVVNDRSLVSQRSPVALGLYAWEWLACRAADKIFLDSATHARYFEDLFRLPAGSVARVFVGAETAVFAPSRQRVPKQPSRRPFTALFYGQFIPLHGIETIVEAARQTEAAGAAVHWIIVGRGQEETRIESLIQRQGVRSIERVPWVPYDRLVDWIRAADACLGIFGTSEKAGRVIPNKVYQILAAQRPLITADTPAIRELLEPGPTIRLVPSGDADALAVAVLAHKETLRHGSLSESIAASCMPVIGALEVGHQLQMVVASLFRGEQIEEGAGGDDMRRRSAAGE